MSEEKALARGHTFDIYKTSFRPLKHTLSGRDERSLMKLVVDAETDKVLGCHIFGPEAGEMVQLVAIALKMGATKADFDATVAVHPDHGRGIGHHPHQIRDAGASPQRWISSSTACGLPRTTVLRPETAG